jgi:hypothetical protein
VEDVTGSPSGQVHNTRPGRWWKTPEAKIGFTTGAISGFVAGIFTISAALGVPLLSKWIDAAPSQLTYKLKYKNTGSTQQDNVLIAMQIPGGSEYVMGSTYIATSVTHGEWKLTNDGIAGRGLNVGSYNPGGTVYLKFKVRPRGKTTFTCSSNGDIGSITISGSGEFRAWVTC